VVLAPLGILQDRNAVCYPSMEQGIEGVNWTTGAVAVDGNVVTGNGPAAAAPFALEMVAQSLGRGAADQVAAGMLL
jgi:4-methyl-5(b-hydroxyethyl)-thiazole monophosphate biosynthesis